MKYVVIDTETSGLFDFSKPADADGQPRLAHLAMLFTADGNDNARKEEYFVKPDGWSIAPSVTAINGLTDAILNEKGTPVADALAAYTKAVDDGHTVVAFNAQYDTKIMRGEMRRAGIDDRFDRTPNICVMRALTDVCKIPKAKGGGYKFPKLSEACAHFGINQEGAHSAVGDAQACLALFHKAREIGALPAPAVHYATNRPTAALAEPTAPVTTPPVEVPREIVGGNNPPCALDFAQAAMIDLGKFLANTPVIETIEHSKEAGLILERVRKTLGDVEDERDAKVRPLNEQVSTINLTYKAVHNTDPKKPGTADKLVLQLKARLAAYIKAEETKRAVAAEEARQAAEEAERVAREAEWQEQEAVANAQVGEMTDVSAAVATADTAFADFQKASRFAARAEQAVPVRISSGLGGPAISMRTKKTLVLDDAGKAIKAIGITEKIREAVLSSARDYRALFDKLPDGISETEDRVL